MTEAIKSLEESTFFYNFTAFIKFNYKKQLILTEKNRPKIKVKILEHLDSVSSMFIFKAGKSFKKLVSLEILL